MKDNLEKTSFETYDVLIIHENFVKNNYDNKNFLKRINKIKILVAKSDEVHTDIFFEKLILPVHINDLNKAIEDAFAKKSFSKNSSIKIKEYTLNKNEKKLIKNESYISLTEKEIQLLELFLAKSRSISKNKILNEVWKYSTEADTHTVETHIYRLRKKIKSKFFDDNFILNDKNGYLL